MIESTPAAGGDVIQRGDTVLEKTMVPKPITSSEVGSGMVPFQPVIVGQVEPETCAHIGLKEDDRIVALDGKPLV